MDRDFKVKQQFAHKLNDDLISLAQQWGVGQDDPRIEDIRKSGQAILDRTEFDLARMALGSPYKEHQEFFVGLTDENYAPRIKGVSLTPNSEERKAAHQLLKSLASHIGTTIDGDNTRPASNATPVTENYVDFSGDGFKETTPDPSIEKQDQDKDAGLDWTYEIPTAEVVDEFPALRAEASYIAEMMKKAIYPGELKTFIKDTLKPRLREVKQELEARRAGSTTESFYRMMNVNLIDFADSLEILMLQGFQRIKQQAPKPEPIALAAPTQPESLESRLGKLASSIEVGLAQAQGAQLKDFYYNRLKPKLFSLKDEIVDLKDSGADQNVLHEKERHYDVIREAMGKAYQKIQAEAVKPKDFYGEVLKPEALALIAEIKDMKESGSDPAALEVKERRLKVLETSMSRLLQKQRAEDVTNKSESRILPLLVEEALVTKAPLVFTTLPIIEKTAENTSVKPWTPQNEVSFKFPDPATMEALTEYPVLSQPEADSQDEHPWEDTVATLPDAVYESDTIPAPKYKEPEITKYRSPNVIALLARDLDNGGSEASNDTDSTNVISDIPSKMQDHPAIEFYSEKPAANEQSFIRKHLKAAFALVAGGFAAVALAASFGLSSGNAPDTQSVKKAATPEPTAQAIQQAAVQQPTVIVAAAAVTNDVESAPVAAEVVAPEPTIEAAPVTPTVSVKTPTIVHHFVAKAKVAAPTVDVQDNTPLVLKTWDIATSRVDLETWNNACKALNQHNHTVEGVCPS